MLFFRLPILEHGVADWREQDVQNIFINNSDENKSKVAVGQTFYKIKLHKRFSAVLLPDTKPDFLHLLLLAVQDQWQDLDVVIELRRVAKGETKKNSHKVSQLFFSQVQVVDYYTDSSSYVFNFKILGRALEWNEEEE